MQSTFTFVLHYGDILYSHAAPLKTSTVQPFVSVTLYHKSSFSVSHGWLDFIPVTKKYLSIIQTAAAEASKLPQNSSHM